jgi:hypothetical protein
MAKYDGFGATLAYDSDGMPTWVDIAAVRNMEGPALLCETIDSTTHDESAGYRSYIEGLRDSGDVTMEIAYDPAAASHAWLHATGRGTIKAYRLTFPDTGATTWSFSGLVTSFTPKEPVDGLMTADVTIKVTTNVTEA